eukprot:2549164-Rhodomonas_salina.1
MRTLVGSGIAYLSTVTAQMPWAHARAQTLPGHACAGSVQHLDLGVPSQATLETRVQPTLTGPGNACAGAAVTWQRVCRPTGGGGVRGFREE